MTVGEKIKQQREYIGMSQDELSRRMGYKDRSSISKIEKGSDKNLSLEIVQKIADILECSPLYLMGWSEEKTDRLSEYANAISRTKKELKMDDKTTKFLDLYSQLDKDEQVLVDNMILALTKKQ